MNPEWRVTFDREGDPGEELILNQSFQWGESALYIPAAYACEEGLVLDICMEIDREAERSFLEKWAPRITEPLSKQEQRQIRRENPLRKTFHCHLNINGEQVKNWHGSSSHWIPAELRPEEKLCHDRSENWLEHYGLSQDSVWSFHRFFYTWPEGCCEIQSLEAKLCADFTEFSGEPFFMPGIGERIAVTNPLTGQRHILTVEDIQKSAIPLPERFADYEMPSEATGMVYRLEPDIPGAEFQLNDTQEQDQARRKDGSPYYGGAVSMMLRMPKDRTHVAASSMRFQAPDAVIWEPVFRKKMQEDLTVKLL